MNSCSRTVYNGFGIIGVCLFGLGFSGAVHAKPIYMKWSAVKGASEYEVELSKDGKIVLAQKTKKIEVEKDVDPGAYTYRIRAFDSFGRFGRWSEQKNLFVTPPAPELSVKPPEEKIEYVGRFQGVDLKWSPVKNSPAYRVEVKDAKTGRVVFQKDTRSTSLQVKDLNPGNYVYVVSSVIEHQGKTYATKGAKAIPLVLAKKPLGVPKDLYPSGEVLAAKDPRIRLEWKKVEGATEYEITVEDLNDRSPAGVLQNQKRYIVKNNEAEIQLSSRISDYRWKVRALASNGEMGNQSISQFKTIAEVPFEERVGSIQLGGSNLQFFGRILNGSNPTRAGSANGMGWSVNLKADYWIKPKLGFEVQYERETFNLSDSSFFLNNFSIYIKTRRRLNDSPYSWNLYTKLGIGQFDSLRFEGMSGAGVIPFTLQGIVSELGIQKILSEDFELSLGIHYFLPTQAADGSPIVQFWQNRLLRFEADLVHRLDINWSVAIGARYDLRNSNIGDHSNPETFSINQAAVSLGIRRHFGNDIKSGQRATASIQQNAQTLPLDSNDPLKANHGVLEIAGGLTPFSALSTSGAQSFSADGTAYRNGIRGEYWFTRYYGFSMDLSSTYYLIGQSDLSSPEFTLLVDRRFFLEKFLGGSILIAKMGASQKMLFELATSNRATTSTILGPVIELELRKLLGKTMVTLMCQYHVPFSVSGTSNSQTTLDPLLGSPSLSTRLKIFYPIWKSLEFGAEGFIESQTTLLNTAGTTTTHYRSNLGGLGLFRYRFGVTY